MASPYFRSMNLPQQDFSVLQNAGRAWGEAYQQAGKAIGEIGSAYFKRKGMEKQASQFIKSKMGKEYLKGMGWDAESIRKIDDDPKEAEKLAYDAIREAGGVENVEARLFRSMQEQRQTELENRQNYLFEQQKAQIEGQNMHYDLLGSPVANPEYTKLKDEASEIRENMQALGRSVRTGGHDGDHKTKINSYLDSLKDINEKLKNTDKQVRLSDLNSSQFDIAYGKPENPYQAMMKQKHIQELQARETELEGGAKALEGLKLLDAQQKEFAEIAMTGFETGDDYVFNESEAYKKANEYAKRKGAQFSKDQMELLAKRVRIVDADKIRSTKQQYFTKDRIDQDREIVRATDDLIALSELANPLGDVAMVEKFARILQPTGILTESDISRVSGSPALVDRINKAFTKLKDGVVDEDTKEDLRLAALELKKSAQKSMHTAFSRQIKDISSSYNINIIDAKNRFYSTDFDSLPNDLFKEKTKDGKTLLYTTSDGKRVYEDENGKKVIEE